MTPVLIIHQDNIWDELDLKIDNGYIVGTLDNFLGVLSAFRLLPMLQEYNVEVLFTKNEEIDLGGSRVLSEKWDKNRLPLVIDVTSAKDCDCSLENFYKFSAKEKQYIKNIVEWHEDFKCKVKDYTGSIEDCDDSWSFIKKGIKTFTFGIPVEGNYHTKECRISIEKFERCIRCLKWVLSALFDSNEH